MATRTVARHHYQADREQVPDHRGRYPCMWCPLPQPNDVHRVPARSDDEREFEARKVGEA